MNGPNRLATATGLAAAFAAMSGLGLRHPYGDTAMPFRLTEHHRSGRKGKKLPTRVWANKKIKRRMAKVSRLINGAK